MYVCAYTCVCGGERECVCLCVVSFASYFAFFCDKLGERGKGGPGIGSVY